MEDVCSQYLQLVDSGYLCLCIFLTVPVEIITGTILYRVSISVWICKYYWHFRSFCKHLPSKYLGAAFKEKIVVVVLETHLNIPEKLIQIKTKYVKWMETLDLANGHIKFKQLVSSLFTFWCQAKTINFLKLNRESSS